MAQVWEGTDEVLARRVAIKILHPHLARDEAFVRRFRGEAIAAARLAHPSIVSVYDTVADDGLNAIIMELVTGTTLRADIDRHGPLQLAAILAIGTQVADALGASHASGLVHRDVKPANILLAADGRVLVADFGIAKAAEGSDLTSDGSMVGTAKYLAPEQVEGGPIDGRTDLYALGVVLYEALTGVPPFVADSDLSTALARLHRDPVRPRQLRPEIPPTVEAVVGRALARRPDDRFPNAAAMRAALVDAGADPAKAHGAAQAAVASVASHGGAALTKSTGPSASSYPPPSAATVAPRPSAALLQPVASAEHSYAPPTGAPGEELTHPTRRSRLPWLALLVAVVVGGGLATLWNGSGAADPGRSLPIASFSTFDPPPGSGGENDHLLSNLTDGDASTGWRTESYKNPDVTVLKPGVGLVATLGAGAKLTTLELTSPSAGWAAEIRVAAGPDPTDLAGWGDVVATIDAAHAGVNTVELGNRSGQRILVWFTNVGPGFATQINQVRVRGR